MAGGCIGVVIGAAASPALVFSFLVPHHSLKDWQSTELLPVKIESDHA
jgi:hypothetical protein